MPGQRPLIKEYGLNKVHSLLVRLAQRNVPFHIRLELQVIKFPLLSS
jgi:hypothetical protein